MVRAERCIDGWCRRRLTAVTAFRLLCCPCVCMPLQSTAVECLSCPLLFPLLWHAISCVVLCFGPDAERPQTLVMCRCFRVFPPCHRRLPPLCGNMKRTLPIERWRFRRTLSQESRRVHTQRFETLVVNSCRNEACPAVEVLCNAVTVNTNPRPLQSYGRATTHGACHAVVPLPCAAFSIGVFRRSQTRRDHQAIHWRCQQGRGGVILQAGASYPAGMWTCYWITTDMC